MNYFWSYCWFGHKWSRWSNIYSTTYVKLIYEKAYPYEALVQRCTCDRCGRIRIEKV